MRSKRLETIKYFTQEELKQLLTVIPNQRIRIHRLKKSLSGEHYLAPDEAKALKSYLRTRKDTSTILFPSRRGDPLSRITLYKMMRKYGARAELPRDKCKFHVLKHSIATHLLDANADISFVKDWLGHADISNTVIYAQLTSPTREQQARRVLAHPKIVR